MTEVEIIMSHVTRGDMLCQLAEECSELAQAALKLRRTFEGTSPTPTSKETAEANLREEIADVMLTALYSIGISEEAIKEIMDIMDAKETRWAKRLSSEKVGD